MIKIVGFLILALMANVNCECTFSGAYSEIAKYAINFDPLYPACKEFHFGGFNVKKAINLAFSNVIIDCRTSNIIITNEYRQPIFNLCQNQLYNLKYESYFVIINFIIYAPFGNIIADMGFSMGEPSNGPVSPPSTSTSTQAPPPTTILSTTQAPPPPPTTTGSTTIVLKCGLPTYKPSDSEMRIVGGTEAVPNSWPWQTFITDGATMCGASLINEQWLLTAAHCVTGQPVKAYLGAHDLSKTYSSSGIPVSKIIKHPNYNTDTLKNDIALMKLERPVQFSDKIQPVCLPEKFNAQPGRVGMVTGWGKVGDYSGTASRLQQAAVPIKSNSECAFYSLSSTQFCAGNTNSGNIKDSCQGDSGGPLVTKEGSNFVLAGIVSYGGPSCDGYGVYTNVYSFVDWIQKTVSAN